MENLKKEEGKSYVLYGTHEIGNPHSSFSEELKEIIAERLTTWWEGHRKHLEGCTNTARNLNETPYTTFAIKFLAKDSFEALQLFQQAVESEITKTRFFSSRTVPEFIVREIHCPKCGLEEIGYLRVRVCRFYEPFENLEELK